MVKRLYIETFEPTPCIVYNSEDVYNFLNSCEDVRIVSTHRIYSPLKTMLLMFDGVSEYETFKEQFDRKIAPILEMLGCEIVYIDSYNLEGNIKSLELFVEKVIEYDEDIDQS